MTAAILITIFVVIIIVIVAAKIHAFIHTEEKEREVFVIKNMMDETWVGSVDKKFDLTNGKEFTGADMVSVIEVKTVVFGKTTKTEYRIEKAYMDDSDDFY